VLVTGNEQGPMTNPIHNRPGVIVGADVGEVMHLAARRIATLLAAAVEQRGVATMALAGGSTPQRLYRLLASPPDSVAAIPWTHVKLFLGDERCVPSDHPESNERMVRESLLADLPEVPAFHPLPGGHPDPAEAAGLYAERLVREISGDGGSVPRFDVVLLGMGDDGHTASLFPDTAILDEERLVAEVYVPRLDSWRLSLTPPVLNAARNVLFLVTGAGKAATLARVIADGPRRDFPASLILPKDGEVEWYVDREAAALIGAQA
jgi:6-phosphogluconolactonase